MAQPTKILEIKGQDWMKGLSIQSDFALGGLFSSSVTNPFKRMGYLSAVPANTEIDNTVITTEVKFLTSINSGTEGYVFGLGDRAGTGTPCFYRIKISDQTVIDYSDKIDQVTTTGAVQHNGLTTYKGRIIYVHDSAGTIYSNTITPTTGNDTAILNSAAISSTGNNVAFGVGSDGILYYTAVSNASIGKIVSTTSTVGNVNNAFSFTDTSLIPKDITNDGIYTIFIADNNTSKSNYGNATCRVFFWDTIKTKADIIYDIPDSYLISARYVDGKVLILGASGIWACNSATPPKLIFPLNSNKLPTGANQVTTKDNILYWVAPGLVNRVYGYGAKIGKPILFNPFILSSTSDLALAFIASGDYFIGSDTNGVFLHDTNGTGVNANALTVPTQLNQTYSFSYAKVVLKAPLSSGQQITLALYNGNGQVIVDTSNRSFATNGAKQTLIFNANPIAGGFSQFEDIFLFIGTEADVSVQRISIYGIPLPDDNSQII